ncbi:NAD-dependent deacylase [Chelativorans salis]|uniref:NAD-dependent protein deacylase n=1 Tax=Chelativorans salis TaxID=2978478 RepID=A0ABT2LGZ8_9HYPH|nr:NAD-dependent deacylase [Chelativorans sp. EGI FJ00035]MCT7373577.1 NAD-dependent deacylase [Chelativorans sp. EGI FJ00035]
MPQRIVILTGAGISAESGVDTFRDKGGIWSRYDYRQVATPEGFVADPALVHDFYNQRRSALAGIAPNPAHYALARLEAEHSGPVTLVTQNIDELHERAGSKNLIHMHGELAKALCSRCGSRHEWRGALSTEVPCPACAEAGCLRPDVVWFGEMPYHMERIYEALGDCDLFLAVGTSGSVYPAAQFVQEASRAGAHTVELNLEPSETFSDFDEAIHGPASRVVPDYVEQLLKGR